jgi:hypothetical protein
MLIFDPTVDVGKSEGSGEHTIDSLKPEAQATPQTGAMIRYFGESEKTDG